MRLWPKTHQDAVDLLAAAGMWYGIIAINEESRVYSRRGWIDLRFGPPIDAAGTRNRIKARGSLFILWARIKTGRWS